MKSNRNVTPKVSAPEQPLSLPSHNGANGHNGNGAPKATTSTPTGIAANGSPQIGGAPHAEEQSDPSAFISSRTDYWITKKERPEIQPDRDIILAVAWSSSGEPVVRAHHVSKFDSVWADAEQVCREVVQDIGANIRSGESHLRELTKRLSCTDRYVEVERKSQPWTVFDAVQLACAILFSLLLLGVDVNSAACTLMESGIETFRDHYWRAAMFNLSVIMGGAFIVKSVSTWLETDLARRRWALSMLILAGIAVGVAVPIFAQTYSRLTADPIALMTSSDGNSQGSNSWWTFALQLLTGNLVAGALWLTAAQIVESHRPSVRAENPMWTRVQHDLNGHAAQLRQEREKLGLFQGKLDIINAKRNQLVTRAVEMYRLAAAEADNSRKASSLLNEFLSDQDKNHKLKS